MKFEIEENDINRISEAVTARVLHAIRPLLAPQVDNQLMTIEQCSEYLHVKTGWLYKRTQLKEIPFIKLGRFCMFKRLEIDAWVTRTGKMPQCHNITSRLKDRGLCV